MPLPERLRRVLPKDTALTWETIASAVPDSAYLGGGTAIAVHLAHRVSRDLDFFYHHDEIDLDALAVMLTELGEFAVTERSPGTLNGVFSRTKVQFLHADEESRQHALEVPTTVEGLRIAGLGDLMAMKLKVVGSRGELRDYFDLMVLEQQGSLRVEEGLLLFLRRYNPTYPGQALDHIVRGLGYFDDVEPDNALPVPREEIVNYWVDRQPVVIIALGRLGLTA